MREEEARSLKGSSKVLILKLPFWVRCRTANARVNSGAMRSRNSDSSGYSIQGQRFSTIYIFGDAFETGDTSIWSNTVQ